MAEFGMVSIHFKLNLQGINTLIYSAKVCPKRSPKFKFKNIHHKPWI